MLSAVTYDCWNTLLVPYDETGAVELRIEALAAAVEIPVEQARVELTEGWQRHHSAWLRSESYVSAHIAQWLLERHGRAGESALLASLTAAFEEASLQTGVTATDGAAAAMAALRSAGVGVAVVCDAGFSPGRVIRQLFARAGLAEHVQVWAFSDEVGACKPRPEMFRCALGGLGVRDPSTTLHVGDLWRTDVCGGRAYGMRTARYTGVSDDMPPPGEPDADLVVASHSDLLQAVLDS